MVKIKSYVMNERFIRQLQITIPELWVKDMNLKVGDVVDVYRDEKDQIIIKPEKKN